MKKKKKKHTTSLAGSEKSQTRRVRYTQLNFLSRYYFDSLPTTATVIGTLEPFSIETKNNQILL